MELSAHLSLLFPELPFLERPAAAAEAGFGSVESWWPTVAVEPWARAVAAAGPKLACLNSWAGDLAAGERGFLNDPAMRERNEAAIAEAVAVCAELGGAAVNVLVGRRSEGVETSEQLAEAIGTLRRCAPLAAEAGVTLVIENLNAAEIPDALVADPATAAAIVGEVDSPAVRMLYDAYHAARAGLDPVADVGDYAGLIGHVQYADCPGRGAPGTGEIDLGAFAESLAAAGYDGPVGLELIPAEGGSAGLASLTLPRQS